MCAIAARSNCSAANGDSLVTPFANNPAARFVPAHSAFSPEYGGGEAHADGVELEDARWFDIGALPELPEPVHISRQLIDAAIARLNDARLSLKQVCK